MLIAIIKYALIRIYQSHNITQDCGTKIYIISCHCCEIGKINLNLTGSIDKVFNLVQKVLVQFQNNHQR